MNKILYVPDPILRQKAKPIKEITSKEIEISKKMIETMLKAPGVGLAANQIGILKKIVTINIKDSKDNNNICVLFNPIISFYSKNKIIMEEGCLSLPQQYAEIERSEEIMQSSYLGNDYEDAEIEKSHKGSTWANILFWPGYFVDRISGSACKYPEKTTFFFKKNTES